MVYIAGHYHDPEGNILRCTRTELAVRFSIVTRHLEVVANRVIKSVAANHIVTHVVTNEALLIDHFVFLVTASAWPTWICFSSTCGCLMVRHQISM